MSKPELLLTLADSGKSFEVYPEEIITVHLNENRTTPYRWVLDKETNINILPLQKMHYALPEKPQFGEGGTLILSFRAKSVGITSIHLKHWCKWEDSTIGRFDVTISVKE